MHEDVVIHRPVKAAPVFEGSLRVGQEERGLSFRRSIQRSARKCDAGQRREGGKEGVARGFVVMIALQDDKPLHAVTRGLDLAHDPVDKLRGMMILGVGEIAKDQERMGALLLAGLAQPRPERPPVFITWVGREMQVGGNERRQLHDSCTSRPSLSKSLPQVLQRRKSVHVSPFQTQDFECFQRPMHSGLVCSPEVARSLRSGVAPSLVLITAPSASPANGEAYRWPLGYLG